MDRSSRNRLTDKLLPQFAGDTLFDAIMHIEHLDNAGSLTPLLRASGI